MECICGVTFPDSSVIWKSFAITTDLVGDDAFTQVEIFHGQCPECRQLAVKIGEPKTIYEDNFRTPEDQYEVLGELADRVRAAHRIFPVAGPSSRQKIDLTGVPEPIASDYQKALIALDHDVLYELASVLARRSLESALRKQYEGPTLSHLVDKLLAHAQNGLSVGLLENIDGIRQLGNLGAHSVTAEDSSLATDRKLCEWCVEVWERFLQEWYVRPARDKTNRKLLEKAGIPPRKPNRGDGIQSH